MQADPQDLPNLETCILERLRQREIGCTLEELADSIPAPRGDVRQALYDLLEMKCVRFADGRWHLDRSSFVNNYKD